VQGCYGHDYDKPDGKDTKDGVGVSRRCRDVVVANCQLPIANSLPLSV